MLSVLEVHSASVIFIFKYLESMNLLRELRKSLKDVKKISKFQGSHSRQPSYDFEPNFIEERDNNLEEDIGEPNPKTNEDHPHLISSKGDTDVVNFVPSIEVYVNKVLLQNCTRTCSSPTMLVRNLLPIIFKEEVLKKCSARGRKANGLGNMKDGARESLYGPAIDAICSKLT
ncbi:uncharacterized protein LOC124155275 [Ischnura elegans]|uniref:uncharacterized protein LOC124155275 n=1 Tax=Ischnura elegans TaxID=197161 RepID=UPI001ED8AE1E|nr:uncharacterized protein LOC124155275 [Ischnura elegans]